MKSLKASRIHFMTLAMMILGLLIGTSTAARAQSAPANLLTNADFKNGLEGWTASSWNKKGTASVDEAERYEGKPTLKVVNTDVDDTQVNQKITLKPHTRYKFSGMIKTKDVEPGNRKSKQGAALCVQGAEKSQSHIHNTPWVRVYVEIDSGPRGETLLGPRLGHNSAGVSGTAWYADLSLVELGPGRK